MSELKGWSVEDLQRILQTIVDLEINYDGDPVLTDMEIRYGDRTPVRVKGVTGGAVFYALTYHLGWNEAEFTVQDVEIIQKTIAAIEHCNVSAVELAPVLDIHYDRLNNGGIGELIQLALESDNMGWIAGRVLDYLESKGHDSGLGNAVTALRDLVPPGY